MTQTELASALKAFAQSMAKCARYWVAIHRYAESLALRLGTDVKSSSLSSSERQLKHLLSSSHFNHAMPAGLFLLQFGPVSSSYAILTFLN